jgi:hypothetical protein
LSTLSDRASATLRESASFQRPLKSISEAVLTRVTLLELQADRQQKIMMKLTIVYKECLINIAFDFYLKNQNQYRYMPINSRNSPVKYSVILKQKC